jgi:hypothetical protein
MMANGNFNIDVTATNADVQITQILNKSVQYTDLIKNLQEKQEALVNSRQDAVQYRERLMTEIKQCTQAINQFKQEVIRLYALFSDMQINRERLFNAKQFFDAGDIKQAGEVLNQPGLDEEVDDLQQSRATLDNSLHKIDEKLEHAAKEYILKASFAAFEISDPRRLEKAVSFVNKAIETFENYSILFDAGCFYSLHELRQKAAAAFSRALEYPHGQLQRLILYYNIGTSYLLVDKAKAKEFLEKGVNLFLTSRPTDVLVLFTMANALHNLALAFTDCSEKIGLLEKAFLLRKDAALADPQYLLMQCWTGMVFSQVRYNCVHNVELLHKDFSEALGAMERFTALGANLDSNGLVEDECLFDLIQFARVVLDRGYSESRQSLADRFFPLLTGFEKVAYKHPNEGLDLGVAKAYYRYLQVFALPLNLGTDNILLLCEKAIFYYRKGLRYRKSDDYQHTELAFCLFHSCKYRRLEGRFDLATPLALEANRIFDQIKVPLPAELEEIRLFIQGLAQSID